LYPYIYPWVEIRIHTYTSLILGGYQTPIGFVISHIKIISK
jgi:hypothetical protein